MLAKIQALVAADPRDGVPEWLLMTARLLWRGREEHFLKTCCHATCARAHTLAVQDGVAGFMVDFGGDHALVVIGGHVYQSYAFESEVVESAYDPKRPLWTHILPPHHEDGYEYLKHPEIVHF
jgi:hypothetical protein